MPRFTQPPVLDGIRSPGEWDDALQLECSVSQILRDGAEFGWIDIQRQFSLFSSNMLTQSPQEDAAIARTDADASAQIWQAWDDDGLYYIAEVRDNIRDVSIDGEGVAWWERDGMSLYLDLLNEKTGGEVTCGEAGCDYLNLNIVNFMAVSPRSSSEAITLGSSSQGQRVQTQRSPTLEGLDYGFREVGDGFGGEADYAIEGQTSWDTLMRFNLPTRPRAGTEMGFSWILLDPDGGFGFEGQLLCRGQAYDTRTFPTWIFSDRPAGPGTAVEEDSWGRVKSTLGSHR